MAAILVPCTQCGGLNRLDLSAASGRQPVCGKCKKDLPVHGAVVEASTEGLQSIVEKSEGPVVVDFWAPWCGPCRQFAPTFNATAQSLSGKFSFVKIDTQAHPSANSWYGVRSIPTLILFKDGQEVKRISGALPEPMFRQWLTT